MTILALYAGTFVLGGILIAASMFGAGGSDGHVGAVHDVHVGHADGGSHEGSGAAVAATLLSLRFWTFALASFGMAGLLLTVLGTPWLVALGLALVTGVGVGAGVTALLRVVGSDSVSSALDAGKLRGRDAEVILAIGPGRTGKIRLAHSGQTLELPATSGEDLERGAQVLMVDVRGGTATVTRARPDRGPPTPHYQTTRS